MRCRHGSYRHQTRTGSATPALRGSPFPPLGAGHAALLDRRSRSEALPCLPLRVDPRAARAPAHPRDAKGTAVAGLERRSDSRRALHPLSLRPGMLVCAVLCDVPAAAPVASQGERVGPVARASRSAIEYQAARVTTNMKQP